MTIFQVCFLKEMTEHPFLRSAEFYPVGVILAAVFLGIFIYATKKPMKA